MLFKNNIDTTEEHRLLINALIESDSISALYELMPEHQEDLSLALNTLSNKLNSENELEDLMYEIQHLKRTRAEKSKFVSKQRYEDAAILHDDVRESEKRLNIYPPIGEPRTFIKTGINELKEYFMFKDSVISETSSISLLVKPGTATKEDIGILLSELSKLYRMLGGSGINFKLEGVSNPKYRLDYE